MTILPPGQVDEITDEEDIDDDTMGEAAVVDVSGSVEVFFIKIRHATFQLPLRPALWSPVPRRTLVELVRQSPQGSEAETRTPLLRHSLHHTFKLPLCPALWSPVLRRTLVELVRQSPQGSEAETRLPLLRRSLHQTFQLPLCPALWSPVPRRTPVELVRQ